MKMTSLSLEQRKRIVVFTVLSVPPSRENHGQFFYQKSAIGRIMRKHLFITLRHKIL
jgi:hypothetical protein